MKKIHYLYSVLFMICLAKQASAQNDAAELAKKLANPIASLVSVPFQNNTDYGIGSWNGNRNTLNFQPVVPVELNKDLKMIARVVLPIITQYNITGDGEKQNGLGDAVASLFFSPSNTKNGVTWGIGPAFLLPLATRTAFASKKFGIGPTAVALKQSKGWTVGALANQIWSIAGNDNTPAVSQAFIQPFVTYNWKSGAGLGTTLEWTQNWKGGTTTIYLVPALSGVTSLGKQKVQMAIGPRFNIAAPDDNADWGWRATVAFLFPKS